MNVGREEPILQIRSFTYISLVVLSVGVCLYIVQQNNDQNQHIQDLRENLGSLTVGSQSPKHPDEKSMRTQSYKCTTWWTTDSSDQ